MARERHGKGREVGDIKIREAGEQGMGGGGF